MSTLKVNTIQNTSAAHSSTPEQIAQGRAKAWVNFNGTGTVAMRDNFNVSSITDSGTGVYTANFTTAMANANYASVVSTGNNDKGRYGIMIDSDDKTTSACKIFGFQTSTGSSLDSEEVSLAIFGD
tara:strand:+ start:317 stop:694 length:378 start_codon:yes stop_codon:yes gene_type:complete